MKIAYLILAHNQPQQLFRLVDRLNQPNVNFYIHIDKKSNDMNAISQHLSKYSNVSIISNHKVYWMGFNMVKSTLDIIQLAVSSGIDFKYYVLLSGQDYPIKSNTYINNFFSRHNTDFISYEKISDLNDNFKNKVRFYHYMDIQYYNPRSPGKIPFLVYLYYGFHKLYRKIMPSRGFYKNLEPYFGSQWFALTGDTIKYILEFLKENKDFLYFMKYTEGPDETFFQTIILNSERRVNLYDYNRYLNWLQTRKEKDIFDHGYSSLRYMDWSERGGKSKPAILDSSYFEILESSDELFARKFDETISAEVLDKLDTYLLK